MFQIRLFLYCTGARTPQKTSQQRQNQLRTSWPFPKQFEKNYNYILTTHSAAMMLHNYYLFYAPAFLFKKFFFLF